MIKAWGLLGDFKESQLKNRNPKTVEAYLSDLKKFSEYFKRDFEEITDNDIECYKSHLLEHKIKVKTVNRKLVSIRKFIEFLNKTNPNPKIEIELKFIKLQRHEYLGETLEIQDLERLIRAAENAKDTRAVAIFYTLYYTGVRVSEMLSLKVNQIDDKYIEILGKGDKVRSISFTDKLRKHIKDYTSDRQHKFDSKIFLNKNKETVMNRQAVHNLIKLYAGKSRIKKSVAHAHNFRHLFAQKLLKEGTLLTTVSDLLGHSNINTTRIYTRETKDKEFEALNKL